MRKRRKIRVEGLVQGVGFRPFAFRLATELGLSGWVKNTLQGAEIEVEGPEQSLDRFITRLRADLRPPARIDALHVVDTVDTEDAEEPIETDRTGEAALSDTHDNGPFHGDGFRVHESLTDGATTALPLPDLATCAACLHDIFDRSNRRYRYPFTNCTFCGPRFSMIRALPYDRSNTTMADFLFCEECESEYRNPRDRRFHAQANACPECGPRLELKTANGDSLFEQDDALHAAAEAIRDGKIVALKGIGGYQLLVDARNETAVLRLRARKHRPAKPFALMYPSLERLQQDVQLEPLERDLLLSTSAPIVLTRVRQKPCEAIAPGLALLGVMLPYSPLHHLLLDELGFPIVATSGNFSEEPICIDDGDALTRLNGIADLFLTHDRPIARPVDDSVVRVIDNKPVLLRRARGFAPLPISLNSLDSLKLPQSSNDCDEEKEHRFLALGGHLKNTIAVTYGSALVSSQHLGDLENVRSFASFQSAISDFRDFFHFTPQTVLYDLHPDYGSTKYALDVFSHVRLQPVQHHIAHVFSGMAENGLRGPLLGVSWDGIGYGSDGSLWGGEWIQVSSAAKARRCATFLPFPLPGATQAIYEPRRSALGALYTVFGDEAFERDQSPTIRSFKRTELRVLRKMLERSIQAPPCSSAGRLFDVVASLLDVRQKLEYEGQAAMALEFLAAEFFTQNRSHPNKVGNVDGIDAYPFGIIESEQLLYLDWRPMVREIYEARNTSEPRAIAARFHKTLAKMISQVSTRIAEQDVLLTGGVFQNRVLTELAAQQLRDEGFRVHTHGQVPPNDGGLSIGQIYYAYLQDHSRFGI